MAKKLGNTISRLWLTSVSIYDPVQYFFNGSFWEIFTKKFSRLLLGNIIDLACGTGELIDHISPEQYLGIDINHEYIAFANNYRKKKNRKFIIGDITQVKLTAKTDTAVFIGAAHHLNDLQITLLCKNIKTSHVKKFILVDGRPVGPFSLILSFLDAKLGGGKYFRGPEDLIALARPYFKIFESGEFTAPRSFYTYPYFIATAIKP